MNGQWSMHTQSHDHAQHASKATLKPGVECGSNLLSGVERRDPDVRRRIVHALFNQQHSQ